MGIITEIQRFSLKDGPGIRTVVFLKGCNMTCTWCHNPEALCGHAQLLVYSDNCIGCGQCVTACPLQLHLGRADGGRFDFAKCRGCGECAKSCYAEALVLTGMERTPGEILEQVARDIPYYKHSGGGVTLSGGEVLQQAAFALELLKLLKAKGISTAIESNLLASWETISTLLPFTDFVMVDIKHMDSDVHAHYTGVANTAILENICLLDRTGIPFVVRTPVIGGVNDTTEVIEEIAGFLAPLEHLKYYELLPFNPLGAPKYRAMEIRYSFETAKPISAERMAFLGRAAEKYGIEVRCG